MQAIIRLIPGITVDGDTNGIYFINIVDDGGNPTNGNNIQVKYRSEQGGVLGSIQTITIPGTSAKIYQGVIQHGTDPFLNYLILGDNIPGEPAPPVISDLAINSVQVTQKADNSGNNGKVTINASCSYLPIVYYIDDVLQDGSINLTVTSGPHTAKVMDIFDNAITQDFTVDEISAILISGPERTQTGLISRWNASFNPIVFTYQRKDFNVTAISQDDTALKPKITVNADITGLVIGDYIYLDAGITNTLSTYKGAYEVLAVIDTSSFVIDTDYLAPDTISGYCNISRFRPYYKVTTKIKYVDLVTGRFNTIVSTNRPGIDGITRADLASFLQSLLNPQGPDKSDYTILNFRDTDLAASYQISYAESWDGSPGVYSEISDPYYCVYSAKQLGDKLGGNLFDYVTQPGGTQLANWLSDFVEPSYTIGFPFDLGFIYSEQIAGLSVIYKIILLDINRNPIEGGDYTSFLLNENSSFLLNDDGSKLVIARQELFNSPIVEHVGLNRLLINQDFDPIAYYFSTQLFYNGSTIATFNNTLTEQTDPFFIDANLEIRIDGVIVPAGELFASGSSSFTANAGKTYRIKAIVGATPGDTPAEMLLTVKKDDVIIFQNLVEAVIGNNMIKDGIVQPGVIYTVTVETSGGFIYTPTDIADNTPYDPGADTPLTNKIVTRLDKSNCQNIVYLRWIGLNGTWNYYRFNYNQTVTLDIQNPIIIKNYIFDWENAQGIEQKISNNASEKMQVYADALDKNDISGLQSIKYSVMVQMLVSNNPIKWQTIIINSSTFTEGDTQNDQSEFSITFNLPSKNIQTQ